jgi:hypothetical protein
MPIKEKEKMERMRLVNLSCTIKKDPQKILQLSGKKTVDI